MNMNPTKTLCSSPVFIGRVHHWLDEFLTLIPNIACSPETFFLPRYCNMYKDRMTESGFSYSEEGAQKYIAWQAAELHDAYKMANGKGCRADKTPQYVEHLNRSSLIIWGAD
jgi:hypothetical protein